MKTEKKTLKVMATTSETDYNQLSGNMRNRSKWPG